jgi:plastocyanin
LLVITQSPLAGTLVGLGTTPIVITVTDAVGHSTNSTVNFTVTNDPPIITSVTGPPDPLALGASPSITVNFTDTGVQSHTCTFFWDDTTSSSVTVGPGATSCTASHTYAAAGVYTVGVTVADDCASPAGTLPVLFEFAVIYDPSGGFVTGGGWINQPPDGYPALSGKANFGFVSKYKKGNNTPEGETEFQFKAGDINFHSSGYDYGSLVISGGKKATYRGAGTVNGQSGYRFVLIAVDGNAPPSSGPDRFRIKITTTGGGLVYDNRMGSSEDPDLSDTTALGGGSIVIHKN